MGTDEGEGEGKGEGEGLRGQETGGGSRCSLPPCFLSSWPGLASEDRLRRCGDVLRGEAVLGVEFLIRSGGTERLDADDRAALGAAQDGDLEWLCLLNVESNPLTVTANLLGPLVINQLTNVARQVVLSGSGYSAKHVVTGGNLEAAFKEVERASANATN